MTTTEEPETLTELFSALLRLPIIVSVAFSKITSDPGGTIAVDVRVVLIDDNDWGRASKQFCNWKSEHRLAAPPTRHWTAPM